MKLRIRKEALGLTVPVTLTPEQYDRIHQLVELMDLDPDEDFVMVAQSVICDSLDRRIEAATELQARRGLGRYR